MSKASETSQYDLGEVTLNFSFDKKRIGAALFTADDIGVIMRCHYEVERGADAALSTLSNGRYAAPHSTFKYLSQKIDLLKLFGIHENFLVPMRTINKHRNDFAHRGHEVITDRMCTELSDNIRMGFRIFDDEFHVEISGKHGQINSRIGSCKPAQRYLVMAVISASIVAAIPISIEEQQVGLAV